MSKLYHFEVFLPTVVNEQHGKNYTLTYSNHAKNACRNDRYGFIIPPKTVAVDKNRIIEAEVKEDRVTKLVIRSNYDKVNDLILVICPDFGNSATVKTVWINRHDDKHKTLDVTPYATE